ncbi:MAG: hypothetical protein GF364_00880, partial [Candidatus Lokiarchaeota archaeon]|nr:hypothetical protein [Candidatus Lokiarchaeota archaeon]
MKVKLKSNNLKVTIADNKSFFPRHKVGYNGIASIKYNDKESRVKSKKNLFVDNYAGLNLEHYFDQRAHSREILFHPRKFPMTLSKIKNKNGVKLVQQPHPPWNIFY